MANRVAMADFITRDAIRPVVFRSNGDVNIVYVSGEPNGDPNETWLPIKAFEQPGGSYEIFRHGKRVADATSILDARDKMAAMIDENGNLI